MKLTRLLSVKTTLVTLFSGVVGSSSAFALGIRLPDQDATAVARANAFVATADNPSAVYYNPAGITQLDGQNLSFGAYSVALGSHFEGAAGAHVDTKSTLQTVPELFYTVKCPKYPLAFGLGVYMPYGLGMEWPRSAPFSDLSRKGRLEYVTLNPVLAWQVLPSLSIAAGPTLNWAQTGLENNRMRFNGRDIDAGFNAGVLWKPLEEHVFGVNYRSATDMNFDGHTDITGGPSGIPTTADFDFPQNVVFGYSYRPTPLWNFEIDADWTDWENLNTLNLKPIGIQMPFNWKSSWMYELGATRYLPNGWSVNGGYIYSQNSVPESSFSASVPDSDRHIFSVGVGKKYETISWNAAYQFAWGPERTIDGYTGAYSAYNGTYEFISHALIFNIGFKF